jgi:hypothetical protein
MLMKHWVFAGMSQAMTAMISSRFKVDAKPQGCLLFKKETGLNCKNVLVVLRGKVTRPKPETRNPKP